MVDVRFEVYLVRLDPTQGHEIQKTRLQRKSGQVVLDQLHTVDKTRLARRLGKISDRAAREVLTILGEMFAP